MLAVRALMAGSFPAIPLAVGEIEVFDVEGIRSDIPDPSAIYANNKTHIGFIREDDFVYVATYDHVTRTLGTPTLVYSGDTDPSGNIHHSIALCRRSSDGRLVAAYCSEGLSVVKFRISTNPDDASSWGSVITAGSSSFTYVSFYQLDNGEMYCFTKRTSGWVIGYFKSSDGGASWGSFVPLLNSGGKSIYWKAGSDGTRIDLFPTDTDRSDGDPSSVYHCYLDADEDLRASDGTLIGAASGGPYDVADGTLVKDASDGPVRCHGWSYAGHPACLLFTYADGTNTVHVARWNGSAWVLSEVADTNGIIEGDNPNRYMSSGAIDKANPDIVYLPVKVGSHFELHRFHKEGTWVGVALTEDSGADYAMPDTPLHADDGLLLVTSLGTYTSDHVFDFDLARYGVAA